MPTRFFITHSWKDIAFAHKLCDDLTAHGLDGFLDAHSINLGDSIPSRIERGLKECDVYIPVFSPDSLKSDWCDWEIDMAITMNRTRKGRPRIIPVIAKPCDVPDRLMHLLYVNFVGRYDDALHELLTNGFNLPATRPAIPAPLEPPVVSPQTTWRNWLLPFGVIITLAIIALVVALALASPPAATPTPSLAAGLTLAAPSTAPTLPAVAVVLTATPASETPTILPPPTNTRSPTVTLLPPTNTRIPTVAPSPIPILGIGSTKIAKDGSAMMFIPAGEFLMGSSDADKDAISNEKPQHTVYLDAYWISKYEVTNALYKKCLDASKCNAPRGGAFSRTGNIPTDEENRPVILVSWNDAAAYAEWMGGRLPTEAEWEKAACWDEAKKVKRIYPWGDMFDVQKFNSLMDATPVGKYSPQGDSPYGVSDMAGNVWEWVADWYSDTYYSASPKNNPKGASSGTYRVLRGGSFSDRQYGARCAGRGYLGPVDWYFNIGFRVVVSSSLDF